jgi:diguanylate cyclase (GGDEF)-like protein
MVSLSDIRSAEILIVNDRDADALAMKSVLENAGYLNVTVTTNPHETQELHDRNHYNLIVLQVEMQRMNGFHVMSALQDVEVDGYLPVLAITDPVNKIQALKSGAKDAISRPFDVDELLTRVHNLLEVRLLHDGTRKAVTTMEILALHDPLTGLGNRRLLMQRISASMANAKRNKFSMAIIYMDLDGFKQINDTLGHTFGDAVLKTVAERLKAVVREEDTVARVGGDEFMVALWHVRNPCDAATVAAKLIKAVSQPCVIEGRSLTVTTSAGVALYPEHGLDTDALMKSADMSLYEAKNGGKNAFRVAIPANLETITPK